MRTKTLLIAAAALAVGIISSEAQVYSQNVVGYINLTVTNHTFAMVANQLDTGSNTLDNVLANGAISSSTAILLWDPVSGGYKQFIYYNSDDSPDGNAGWYDLGGNPSTNKLDIGSGGFIHNSAGSDITFTLVGQVVQGTNQYPVVSGYNIYSIPEPLSTNLDSVKFPAISSSTTYVLWNGAGFNPALIYYNADDSPDGNAGWYLGGTPEDGNPAVWPKVGQSFFINHPGGSDTWTNGFMVP
jgi:hypothetical protein